MKLDTKKAAQDAQLAKNEIIIQACKELLKNEYWLELKTYLIDEFVETAENRVEHESDQIKKAEQIGAWVMAKKFQNLQKIVDLYQQDTMRILQNGKT